jgi:hypothetical protein
MKDEIGDLLASDIFNRWKNYFSQLLNVRIRQIEIHQLNHWCMESSCECGNEPPRFHKMLGNP